jgi:hypothetical protein
MKRRAFITLLSGAAAWSFAALAGEKRIGGILERNRSVDCRLCSVAGRQRHE